MVRWLIAWLGSGLWAFLVTGLIGLVEAGARWGRHGLIGGSSLAEELLAAVPATAAVYGCFGAAVGWLAFWPGALVGRLRPRPRRVAFCIAVGGATAALLVILADHAARTHVWPELWPDAGLLARVALTALWFALLFLSLGPLARLAERLARWSDLGLIALLLIMIAAVRFYPDWRAMGRHDRTALGARGSPFGAQEERVGQPFRV